MSKALTVSGRNILQDLIFSSVILTRVKLPKVDSHESPDPDKPPISKLTQDELCGICGSWSELSQPLTSKEMGILEEFVSSCPLVSSVQVLCPGCCSVLDDLTKLKKKILLITQCLKALIRVQHKNQGKIHIGNKHSCNLSSCHF